MKIYKILNEKDFDKLTFINKGLLELNLDPTEEAWPESPRRIKGRIYKDESFGSERARFIFAYRIGDYNGIGGVQSISSNLVRSLEDRADDLLEEGPDFLKKWSNFIYEKEGELYFKLKYRNVSNSCEIMNAGKVYRKSSEKLEEVGVYTSPGKCA